MVKKEQLDFLEWELGVFFHFGIRTFYEGHKDWDLKPMAAEGFDPTQLDCNQWIKIIKEAGAKYAILVCKHHDGFANWPSKYTDYSVANTSWKDGKGDVVKEYVDACRAHDIKVGLYYSPAEFGSKGKSPKEYDDYFVNQISELLSGYGKVDYLWFDGCGSENHEYDKNRIIKTIRSLQPGILIFNMWDPDTRWVGNEAGITPMPNHYSVTATNFSVLTETLDDFGEEKFLPTECDFRMRFHNWFYSENDADTVKSVDELMGIYYYSVGRGSNFLINIAPDRRGLLPDKDAKRFIEFGNEVRRRFSNPIAGMQNTMCSENTYLVQLERGRLVNHVVMKEDLERKEQVQKFKVFASSIYGDREILVYEGYTIGHKHICRFESIHTKKIKIVIEKEKNPHKLKDISVYYVD